MAFKSVINGATANQAGAVTTGGDTLILAGGVRDKASGHYLVTQNGTPNMTVLVAAGDAMVPRSTYAAGAAIQRFVPAFSSASESVVITANASGNPRIDVICIKIDPAASAGAEGVGAVSLVAVAGTPAASPTVPATPSNYLALAQVAVANGASSIVTANITDVRVQMRPITTYLQDSTVVNGKFSVAVASNNLTLSLLTEAGTVPSTTDPVAVMINGTVRYVTSALTVPRAAGTSWGGAGASILATQTVPWFIYLAWDATNSLVRIGFSRIPYASTYADFSATTTDERYGAFSTAPASGDFVVNTGRFLAALSATASFNWSISGTGSVVNMRTLNSDSMTFVPTVVGWSGSPTVSARYVINNRIVRIELSITGTSNATSATATLPFTNRGLIAVFNISYAVDNGGDTLALYSIQPAAASLATNRINGTAATTAIALGTFTSSGNKQIFPTVTYQI